MRWPGSLNGIILNTFQASPGYDLLCRSDTSDTFRPYLLYYIYPPIHIHINKTHFLYAKNRRNVSEVSGKNLGFENLILAPKRANRGMLFLKYFRKTLLGTLK